MSDLKEIDHFFSVLSLKEDVPDIKQLKEKKDAEMKMIKERLANMKRDEVQPGRRARLIDIQEEKMKKRAAKRKEKVVKPRVKKMDVAKPAPKAPKECPEGKVLNPKTGRFVKIKAPKVPKAPKECPEGKVINPKTGRCIKKK